MLVIADNIGDYFAYQLELKRDLKIRSVSFDKLETKLNSKTANNFGDRHNSNTSAFNSLLEEEMKKYR